MLKIVIIGAGSQVFGRRAIVDIMLEPFLNLRSTEVVLVDASKQKLTAMYKLATMLKEHLDSPIAISAESDRKAALERADYVFISVSNRRYELWEQDFRVPAAYGFHQAYGENGGPGALFHALRNIHLIMGICDDIKRLCPGAFVFNFSNPESRILLAIHDLTDLNAIGICHGQNDALIKISELLDRDLNTIHISGGGVNHFFWINEITDKESGEDLYPLVRELAQESDAPDFSLAKKLLEIYGKLTYPLNTHSGEFVPFGSDYTGKKWAHGLESRRVTDIHKSKIDMNIPYLKRELPLDDIAIKSRETTIPMIVAHYLNKRTYFYSGNVMNDGLYIPNLLQDAIVEVPVEVDAAGVHPLTLPPLPEGVAALSRTQMSIQKLTVQAYKERSKNLLLQTLLLEPVVDSIPKAEALIEDMLYLQADFIPQFK